MSAVSALITEILEAARSEGLDQQTLAVRAGVRPETVSRAKKRESMDVSTLADLARAAGLQLALLPSQDKVPSLADPKWGLAWSNPEASKEALVRNALSRGAFSAVLEASVQYGPRWVRAQWGELCASADAPSARWRAHVDRMLGNIEKGFSDAAP